MAKDGRNIGLELDQALSTSRLLEASHDGIPAGSRVREIIGAGGEPGPQGFHQWLQNAAEQIGSHTDRFRNQLAQNTAALKQAAADLQAHDEMSAADLVKFDSAIDATTAASESVPARVPQTPAAQAAQDASQQAAAGQL